ncbi:type II secretion system protein [Candidatus Sumerlaeota bacterium]|nr:type II secretion system protein [Candidatus Sumerlaeota bacterium]
MLRGAKCHNGKRRTRALTLIEVVVGMAVLALMSISLVGLMLYGSGATRLNTNYIAAKNIAQGLFEMMYIDEFADVNPTNYPNIDYNDANPVYLDAAIDIRCKVDYEFKGIGIAESGTATTLYDADADWENNEWAGDTLFIVCDDFNNTSGQYAQITGNTNNTLTLGSNLAVSPKNTSCYMINNGKTVEITTTWRYKGQAYSRTVESLIVNYRGDNIGLDDDGDNVPDAFAPFDI